MNYKCRSVVPKSMSSYESIAVKRWSTCINFSLSSTPLHSSEFTKGPPSVVHHAMGGVCRCCNGGMEVFWTTRAPKFDSSLAPPQHIYFYLFEFTAVLQFGRGLQGRRGQAKRDYCTASDTPTATAAAAADRGCPPRMPLSRRN